MKISIITVCYNAGNYIQKSIESVINQDYKNIEYIIIDGNSQDHTREIIEKYSYTITKFISEPDNGIYHAMNKGIKLASGDYIYFLGSDDYLIDAKVISDVVAFIKKNPQYQFVYGNIEVRSDNKHKSYIHKPSKPDYVLDELISGCLPHQASFAHSSLFDSQNIGLFNEKYKSASDYEWFLKTSAFALEQNKPLGYYDRIIASYNSLGVSSNVENALKEMFEIQNNIPIYQNEDWLKHRIKKYQQILINPNGHWNLERIKTKTDNYSSTSELSRLQENCYQLQSELSKYKDTIEAMENSKFWKIRNLWLRYKKIFNFG